MAEFCTSSMGDLVQSLTENANLELNQHVFKKIKQLCRLSSENVSHAFYLLMTQLRKEHAEIRYIILVAINELFLSSYEFRMLLENNLEEFLELTLETNPEKFLPPPKAVAERVKCQAQCIIKSWHVKFGDTCKRLDLACSFLKNCKNINLESTQPLVNDSRKQHEFVHRGRSVTKKISAARKEFKHAEAEILNILTQIENCFRLVVPAANNLFTSSDFIEYNASKPSVMFCHHDQSKLDSSVINNVAQCDEFLDTKYLENTHNKLHLSLRQHGITGIKSNISVDVKEISSVVIEENENNFPILENLNDLHRQISSKHLPSVIRWSKIFTQGEDCTDILRKTIDLKCSLEEKMTKFSKLSFTSKTVSDDSINYVSEDENDSDFEEVKEKEDFEQNAVPEKSCVSAESNTGKGLLQPSWSFNIGCESLCQNFKISVANQNVNDGASTSSPTLMSLEKNISVDQPSSSYDWQDPELLEDIKAATGVDLKIPVKRKKKNQTSKRKTSKKESIRANLKAAKNTTYNRLYKKIFRK